MYAIAFDMDVSKLKEHFGEPYNPAYDEIRKTMQSLGFEWVQGSIYRMTDTENGLTKVYTAINTLQSIGWFRPSVRDIRAFKIEDWSDFTPLFRK